MKRRLPCLAAIGMLIVAGGAVAAAHAAGAGGSGTLSGIDKDYLKSTAQSNLEEIQFEPAVLAHAGDSAVKQFGRQMHEDHTNAQASLKRVANEVGFNVPKGPSEDQKDIMKRLKDFRGSKFDAAYKQEMVRDHTTDIADSERELSLGSNPRVIALAKQNLQVLHHHLEMSRALPGPTAEPGTATAGAAATAGGGGG